MAKIVQVPKPHIECECGETLEIVGAITYQICRCDRVYRVIHNGVEYELGYAGWECWKCHQFVPTLYTKGRRCYRCLEIEIRTILDQIASRQRQDEFDKKRLKKYIDILIFLEKQKKRGPMDDYVVFNDHRALRIQELKGMLK